MARCSLLVVSLKSFGDRTKHQFANEKGTEMGWKRQRKKEDKYKAKQNDKKNLYENGLENDQL